MAFLNTDWKHRWKHRWMTKFPIAKKQKLTKSTIDKDTNH